MPSVRPFVTAGVALVGASVIAVSPVTPTQPQIRTVGMDVALVAATTNDFCQGVSGTLCQTAGAEELTGAPAAAAAPSGAPNLSPSLFNIPANLFIALANVPYNFFNALGQGDVNLGDLPDSGFSFTNSRDGIDLNQTGVVGLTADLEYGGSWWVYHPFNVLGTDSADIARYQSLVNVLLPFPALSVGLGNILATVAASQLPMNVGCTGTNVGGCDHPEQILSTMFDLRHIVALFSPGGYTFPAVKNPITCSSDGLCDIKDPDGEPEPWSEGTYALNLFDPFENFYNSLLETPDFSQIKLPTLQMIVGTITGLLRGLNTAFNPFVVGTQCGLCSLFVKVPPGETRPGPINPGAEIPGKPGTQTATLVAATDTAAADAPPVEQRGGASSDDTKALAREEDSTQEEKGGDTTSAEPVSDNEEPQQGDVDETDDTTVADDVTPEPDVTEDDTEDTAAGTDASDASDAGDAGDDASSAADDSKADDTKKATGNDIGTTGGTSSPGTTNSSTAGSTSGSDD
ncbi:hypothetical protein BST22_06050 [Mycolicibacterium chubuense]|uniref:PE-PPE domain-containing protein n=1 Tax=Mycolicibacterium chubuense TaxID=1800 RepID=A0A0J6VS30_MYCCU|nr:hypothetical protein [Mycolicibacterium chubuense]KMO73845.1 hypothetical protein MCHUDSM44219_03897 [Mycolicibacterium chubuense]ORA54950.1 hypothetical protein BST22_06050 [Mycolicibacterium chubuense]SPX97647.1 PE-PPE domain-containing protein [Mycolicibacterium chubuense]